MKKTSAALLWLERSAHHYYRCKTHCEWYWSFARFTRELAIHDTQIQLWAAREETRAKAKPAQ